MPRLRQQSNMDCVPVVFCYITGEDYERAKARFIEKLSKLKTPEEGIAVDTLRCCLKEAGWTLTFFEGASMQTLGKDFKGEAVIYYTKDGAKTAHTVLVRSGGIVLDPHPSQIPDKGEFIQAYFAGVGGRDINISAWMVTRAA